MQAHWKGGQTDAMWITIAELIRWSHFETRKRSQQHPHAPDSAAAEAAEETDIRTTTETARQTRPWNFNEHAAIKMNSVFSQFTGFVCIQYFEGKKNKSMSAVLLCTWIPKRQSNNEGRRKSLQTAEKFKFHLCGFIHRNMFKLAINFARMNQIIKYLLWIHKKMIGFLHINQDIEQITFFPPM